MIPRGVVAIALWLLLTSDLSAQQHSQRTFFPHVWDDQKRIWTFPAQKDSWQDRGPYLFLAASAASFLLDGSSSRELRSFAGLRGFNDALASLASDAVLTVLPLALLATGEIVGHEKWTDLGWRSTESAVDAVIVSYALKAATQRPRPHRRECGFWKGGNSFPSGHSIMAWSLAAVASDELKEHKWVPWVVYPAAGLISFSRVSSGHHHASDAVVGSLLGYTIGRFASR